MNKYSVLNVRTIGRGINLSIQIVNGLMKDHQEREKVSRETCWARFITQKGVKIGLWSVEKVKKSPPITAVNTTVQYHYFYLPLNNWFSSLLHFL